MGFSRHRLFDAYGSVVINETIVLRCLTHTIVWYCSNNETVNENRPALALCI